MRDGTPVTFGDWAAARTPALLRFAFLVAGDQQAAEDAVQTALARAVSAWERIRAADDPDAYVRRMVVNAHISAWRRVGRRETPTAEAIPAAVPDPSGMVLTADSLWRACADLPPHHRAALVLRYYEDLDYPEIARVLDCAEATARSHVHRALTALRAQLDSEDFHD